MEKPSTKTQDHHHYSPLFSVVTAVALLALLYLPRSLIFLFFSPAPISALLLLSTLFHFNSSSDPSHHDHQPLSSPKPGKIYESPEETRHRQCFSWISLGLPLDVIYEEYEGESDEDSTESLSASIQNNNIVDDSQGTATGFTGFEFMDTDSDRSDGFTTSTWEDDNDEELIEIALEEEEEGLIEIDISIHR